MRPPTQRREFLQEQLTGPLSGRIRSGGGTSTKTPVTAMSLWLFKVITLQPRRGFAGSEGATSTFQEPSGRYG
jgi:hypothetical protein